MVFFLVEFELDFDLAIALFASDRRQSRSRASVGSSRPSLDPCQTSNPRSLPNSPLNLESMYSSYRVSYQLRAHKRDSLIEFIKSLLLTPFVLHLQPDDLSLPLHGQDHSNNNNNGNNNNNQTISEGKKDHPFRIFTEPRHAHLDTVVPRFLEIFSALERLIDDHRAHQEAGTPELSKLFRLVPTIGTFFTRLPLADAFLRQNVTRSMAGRRQVPPSFNDIRHVLNTAQILAIAELLKIITFDGDLTLYEDGSDLDPSSPLIELIGKLIVDHGVHVAIVTAAGYTGPNAPSMYWKRLGPLLAHVEKRFRALGSSPKNARVFVFGGESSYLFSFGPQVDDPDAAWSLEPVEPEDYLSPDVASWSLDTDLIGRLLDVAQASLENTARLLGLMDKIKVIRKPRSVGIIPDGCKLEREQLDEFALATQDAIARWDGARRANAALEGVDYVKIPYCAFNGGNDCFVDVGNKLIGVSLLLNWLGLQGGECLHVGDQFLATGNDVATRSACSTVWVAGVSETAAALEDLIAELEPDDGQLMSPMLARLPLERLPSVQVAGRTSSAPSVTSSVPSVRRTASS